MMRPTERPTPKVVAIPPDYMPADLESPVAIDYDGFTLVVRFREVDGRLEVWSIEVNVIPFEGRKPRRITASNLRLPWADVIRTGAEAHLMRTAALAIRPKDEDEAEQTFPLRKWHRENFFQLPPIEGPSQEEATAIDAARTKLPAAREAFAEARRGRPQEHDPNMVADVYRAAFRAGLRPTKAVADKFGMTPSAAAKQVARARQLGILEPAPKAGVPGLARTKQKRKGR